MFVDIVVILARAKSSVFLFDEEEREGLRRVGWVNLFRGEVLIKEVFGGFSFFRGERIYFSNLWGKGVI